MVLVDFKIDRWDEEVGAAAENGRRLSDVPFLNRPVDGLAVAATLQGHLRAWERERQGTGPTPTATLITLYSAKLGDLADQDAAKPEHYYARAFGLDWVFKKGGAEGGPPVADRVRVLRDAVDRLAAKDWGPHADVTADVRDLLSIPADEVWSETAWGHATDCHPPLRELSRWTDGHALVRWILHRILPYPCFLRDAARMALLFEVPVAWMIERLADGTPLADRFAPALYSGLCAGFDGPRWWEAGVRAILVDELGDGAWSVRARRDWLTEVTHDPSDLDAVPDRPVLCIDENYHLVPELVATAEAVRVRPDGWPPFAAELWMRIDTILESEDDLRSLVAPHDRDRLPGEGND